MQVYGLVGQSEEGIWPEANLINSLNRGLYFPDANYDS